MLYQIKTGVKRIKKSLESELGLEYGSIIHVLQPHSDGNKYQDYEE